MKGQYLTVEWVFFFAIGVILVTLIFMMFSTVSLTYRSSVVGLQLQRSGEIIRSGIVNAFESSKTDGTVTINISIPTQVSRCIYTIETGTNLILRCVDNANLKAVLNLYGINTISGNIIYSTNGLVRIKGQSGTVELS